MTLFLFSIFWVIFLLGLLNFLGLPNFLGRLIFVGHYFWGPQYKSPSLFNGGLLLGNIDHIHAGVQKVPPAVKLERARKALKKDS